MEAPRLRLAMQEDAPALLDIYRAYIDTEITFEYVPPSLEEFSERVASISARCPYLVLEEGSERLGCAYAHPIGERAAYSWGRSCPSTSGRTRRGEGWDGGCTER